MVKVIEITLKIEVPDGVMVGAVPVKQVAEARGKLEVEKPASADERKRRDTPANPAPESKKNPYKPGTSEYQKFGKLSKKLGRPPTEKEMKTDWRSKGKYALQEYIDSLGKKKDEGSDEEVKFTSTPICNGCGKEITRGQANYTEDGRLLYHSNCKQKVRKIGTKESEEDDPKLP